MPTPQPQRPCLFFDRDGIANVSPGTGYVNSLRDFHIRPHFLHALRAAATKHWPCLIITNQSGVNRGLTPRTELNAMHAALHHAIAAAALPPLLDILVCPSTNDAHPDRKPHPGLLLTAAARHHLDLSRSWMIGDREKDVLTGRNARLAVTVRIDDDGSPSGSPDAPLPTLATYHLPRLSLLPQLLLTHLPTLPP